VPEPTYDQVCTGETGHNEVVKARGSPCVDSPCQILRRTPSRKCQLAGGLERLRGTDLYQAEQLPSVRMRCCTAMLASLCLGLLCSGSHAEDVPGATASADHGTLAQVTFDPSQVTFDQLLEVFFQRHDPTQLNRQVTGLAESRALHGTRLATWAARGALPDGRHENEARTSCRAAAAVSIPLSLMLSSDSYCEPQRP